MRKPAILLFLTGICLICSCKKSALDDAGTSVEFVNGGVSNFDESSIIYTGDTTLVDFSATLSPNSIKNDVTVNIAVNDAARLAYNSGDTLLQYDPLPDSCYTLNTQSAKISSGNLAVDFSITFYHLRIDPKISYMLPVSITNAGGVAVNDTLGTIYFHINGNFLSAAYNNVGTKTEYYGGQNADSVIDVITCPQVKYFQAISPNVSAVDYADLGSEGWQYLVTIDSATNTLTSVTPNGTILGINGAQSESFGIDTATYNSSSKTFHFVTHYSDKAGNFRIVSETLTKQ